MKTRKQFFIIFIFFILILGLRIPELLARSKMVIIGRIEWIIIPALNVKLKARIDTGAQTSSLHAINPRIIKVDGERFVEFTTLDRNGKPVRHRRRVIKTTSVRGTEGLAQNRYVIKERVILGGVERQILMTLNDRTVHKYKFLVGRNLLRGKFLVDVAKSHTKEDE